MYTDKYNTYDSSCIPYSFPYSFQDGCKLDYMVGNDIPTYELDCGDTIILPFCIEEKYSDMEIVISLYNFRYEIVYETVTIPDSEGIVYLIIDNTLTEKLYKGIYRIRLQAREQRFYMNDLGELEEYHSTCTILDAKECLLYIK